MNRFASVLIVATVLLTSSTSVAQPEQDIAVLQRENEKLKADRDAQRKRLGLPPVPGVYKAVAEILQQLPKELRPKSSGWDKFTLPKVKKWLEANAVGSSLGVRSIIHFVEISPIQDAPAEKAWRVTVRLRSTAEFQYAGCEVRARLLGAGDFEDGSDTLQVEFECDEVTARLWDSRPAKSTVNVAGTVASTRLETEREDRGVGRQRRGVTVYSLDLTLRNLDVTLSDPRERVRQLRAANEGLRKEIADLRQPAKAAARGPKPPAGVRTMAEVLADLPANLRPDPKKGWDKFARPKVQEWMNENVAGQKLQFTAALAAAPSVNHAADDMFADGEWAVGLRVADEVFEFAGWRVALRVRKEFQKVDDPDPIVFRGDEAFARRMEKGGRQRDVTLRATIARVSVGAELGRLVVAVQARDAVLVEGGKKYASVSDDANKAGGLFDGD